MFSMIHYLTTVSINNPLCEIELDEMLLQD